MLNILGRIVSGGQTGVDRAALDVALELSMDCGGWCPRERRTDDGPLEKKFPLQETPLIQYGQRTSWNVRDSDGTLILYRTQVLGGTRLTWALARHQDRPCLLVDLDQNPDTESVLTWIVQNRISTLNVAGPRESSSPGVYTQARSFLHKLLDNCSEGTDPRP